MDRVVDRADKADRVPYKLRPGLKGSRMALEDTFRSGRKRYYRGRCRGGFNFGPGSPGNL